MRSRERLRRTPAQGFVVSLVDLTSPSEAPGGLVVSIIQNSGHCPDLEMKKVEEIVVKSAVAVKKLWPRSWRHGFQVGLSFTYSKVLHKRFLFFGLVLHVYSEGTRTKLHNLEWLFTHRNAKYLHFAL